MKFTKYLEQIVEKVNENMDKVKNAEKDELRNNLFGFNFGSYKIRIISELKSITTNYISKLELISNYLKNKELKSLDGEEIIQSGVINYFKIIFVIVFLYAVIIGCTNIEFKDNIVFKKPITAMFSYLLIVCHFKQTKFYANVKTKIFNSFGLSEESNFYVFADTINLHLILMSLAVSLFFIFFYGVFKHIPALVVYIYLYITYAPNNKDKFLSFLIGAVVFFLIYSIFIKQLSKIVFSILYSLLSSYIILIHCVIFSAYDNRISKYINLFITNLFALSPKIFSNQVFWIFGILVLFTYLKQVSGKNVRKND